LEVGSVLNVYVRVDNGEFIEGDLIHYRENRYFILPQFNGDWDILEAGIEVIPETVEQLTGLPFRIFEGDIIKPKKFETPYVVFWNEENCCFSVIDKYQYEILQSDDKVFATSILQNKSNINPRWILEHQFEVIGNIHDNPELLK
jgi:hypothetical protein